MPLTHFFLALLFLQTPKPGSVSGIVTNAVTGGPVRKAQITLRANETTYTATTDAEGHFAIAGVNPGTYWAIAQCTGFKGQPRPEPVRVAEDQQVTDLAFPLTPNGVITGKVVDENGDPLPQISVQAQAEVFSRAGRTLSATGMALTDDRGIYRFFDLPPGRYFVVAANPSLAAPNGRLHMQKGETAYVTTWFPGVTEGTGAAANQLAPGAELSGIDIRLRKVRVYHIRGKAVAAGSQQRLDAPVMLTPCDATVAQGLYAPILRDGSFDAADVVPGVWCAVIIEMTENRGWYARQTVTVTDHDVDNVVMTAMPMGEIRGQVLVDGAPPTKGLQMPVQLETLENPGRSAAGSIRPDGSFAIPNTQPGPYRVGVNLPGMYLKAVRLNGQETADARIQVPASGAQLTLLMATDSGEISGTVRGSGQYVTALASSSPGSVPIPAFPGNSSNFVIRNLPPGDYQVLAWETRDAALVEYPEFRKQFDSQAVSVTVHPKGHESVALTAVTAAEIEAAKARLK